MQYIVIAHDSKDEGTLDRRMSVREAHLKFADTMFKEGRWLFACALLDDEGQMNGSVIVCDYPSKEELRKQWLEKETYVIYGVWEKITIKRAQVALHNTD